MTEESSDARKLRALIDAVEADILNARDEEILEDIRSTEDPEQVVKRTKNIVKAAVTAHRQKELQDARTAYNAATRSGRDRKIPSDPQERRGLLQKLINSGVEVPMEVTLAFRDGRGMSDADIGSTLEDLVDLGLLEDEKK